MERDKLMAMSVQPETSAPEQVTRRGFLERFIGGSMGVLAATYVVGILAYLAPAKKSSKGAESPTDVGLLDDLPKGKAKVVQHADKPVIVVHGEKGPIALSAVCTHLGCVVQWDTERKQIKCPCHAGMFDLQGNVVGGPPPRPLPMVPIQVKDGHILVGGAT